MCVHVHVFFSLANKACSLLALDVFSGSKPNGFAVASVTNGLMTCERLPLCEISTATGHNQRATVNYLSCPSLLGKRSPFHNVMLASKAVEKLHEVTLICGTLSMQAHAVKAETPIQRLLRQMVLDTIR